MTRAGPGSGNEEGNRRGFKLWQNILVVIISFSVGILSVAFMGWQENRVSFLLLFGVAFYLVSIYMCLYKWDERNEVKESRLAFYMETALIGIGCLVIGVALLVGLLTTAGSGGGLEYWSDLAGVALMAAGLLQISIVQMFVSATAEKAWGK